MKSKVRTAALAVLITGATAAGSASAVDLGREPIPANDGWASTSTSALPNGTTGGSLAAADRVFTVANRNQLVVALSAAGTAPRIIQVAGTINANVADDGNPLYCEDYYRADPASGEMYALEKYLAAYDPATWGRVPPAGPQEEARKVSAAAQSARIRMRVPANTTIVGLGADARIIGAWFDIRPGSGNNNAVANVIIRNVTFEDVADCFPAWDPTDGSAGNWNSLYDAISVRNATHVWIDHNTFLDRETRDERLPTYFGRLYQVHDGHVDVTNASDYVTVSWNRILDHDKVMLIGSSDSATASDRNRLRVTLHHNFIAGVGQRVPRVRFGQVHVYNNFYKVQHVPNYGYSWGVGRESQIYAENNFFITDKSIAYADLIERLNGSRITAIGTRRAGEKGGAVVDVVAAWNAVNDPDLLPDAGWAPVLYGPAGSALPANDVPDAVEAGAGPGNW
jgi:pectate lyase